MELESSRDDFLISSETDKATVAVVGVRDLAECRPSLQCSSFIPVSTTRPLDNGLHAADRWGPSSFE